MTTAETTPTITPVFPEFNMPQAVVDDLTDQLVSLQKQVSILKAELKSRDEFVRANAHLLGLEVDAEGNVRPAAPEVLTPVPNRAAKRARAPRTTGKSPVQAVPNTKE